MHPAGLLHVQGSSRSTTSSSGRQPGWKNSFSVICPSGEEGEFLLTVYVSFCSKSTDGVQPQSSAPKACCVLYGQRPACVPCKRLLCQPPAVLVAPWQRKLLISYANLRTLPAWSRQLCAGRMSSRTGCLLGSTKMNDLRRFFLHFKVFIDGERERGFLFV